MDHKLTLLGVVLVASLVCVPNRSYGQAASYTKAATAWTGSWPSMNNQGYMVWSQLDQNGFWQVWRTVQGSPFCSTIAPVTTGNQNHERPVIDDNGDIVYFQDGTGQGAGWEVVLLQPNKQSSVLEFSSANPSSCKPPNDPNCTAWHTAGQNFGISSNGTTITYYDFCTPGPTCVRRFDVSGIGTLQCSGASCNFWGYDYPTINSNGQIAFTDASGKIYYTATASPQVPGTLFAPGQCPHLADWSAGNTPLDPQISFVKSSNALCPVYGETVQASSTIESNLLLNAAKKQVAVDSGVWASVNNSGGIIYQTENSNTSPIWFAGNTNGVDLSCPASKWADIQTQYAPRFIVVDAWGGKNSFPAAKTIAGALKGNPNLLVAAYAFLNLNSGAPTPEQQMDTAMTAVGPQYSSIIKFLAIDIESGFYDPNQQSQNVDSIISAASYIKQTYGVNPVIYSNPSDWVAATGNSQSAQSIGSCAPGGLCIPLWNARYDSLPDLFDDEVNGTIAPWVLIGGWLERAGKQYVENCSENKVTKQWTCAPSGAQSRLFGADTDFVAKTNPCKGSPFNGLDLDVFAVSLF